MPPKCSETKTFTIGDKRISQVNKMKSTRVAAGGWTATAASERTPRVPRRRRREASRSETAPPSPPAGSSPKEARRPHATERASGGKEKVWGEGAVA